MTDDLPIIDVQKLSKTYSVGSTELHALRGVSLRISSGEFVAIMGASGSGKSTFMNIIGCLDLPTSGSYHMSGVDVRALRRNQLADLRNKSIGFIFQSFNILKRTTALENVELPLMYAAGLRSSERRERAVQCLKDVGLADRILALPNELSGGQQQRIAIARALVNKPLVILADEPTGNLDSRTSYEILELFQRLNDQGITVVMVTHEPDIAACAKRVIVFRDGVIVSDSLNPEPHKAHNEIEKLQAIHASEALS